MKVKKCVPYDEGMKLVEKANNSWHKDYDKPSPKAMEIIKEAGLTGDRKGNIKCSDRMIEGMKEVGVRFDAKIPKEE